MSASTRGSVALALVALAPLGANAIGFVAGVTPYCRAFAAGGGVQEVTLLTPIPVGHGIHLGIVTSANVAYDHTTDVGGNT